MKDFRDIFLVIEIFLENHYQNELRDKKADFLESSLETIKGERGAPYI